MNIFTVILVFVVTWWLVLFPMLSRGVTSQCDHDEKAVPGTDPGAPVAPKLRGKLIRTTIIATVITLGFYVIVDMGLIDFRTTVKPWDK